MKSLSSLSAKKAAIVLVILFGTLVTVSSCSSSKKGFGCPMSGKMSGYR